MALTTNSLSRSYATKAADAAFSLFDGATLSLYTGTDAWTKPNTPVDPTTELVRFTLQNPAFNPAEIVNNIARSVARDIQAVQAIGAGLAESFRLVNAAGDVLAGTVTGGSGNGDLKINGSGVLAVGQFAAVTSFVLTVPSRGFD